jgi:23S rRNA (cytosine1962-C5)-methyltransferase
MRTHHALPAGWSRKADASMKDRYPRIVLKKGRDMALRRGHPWLFSGAVSASEGHPGPGDIVEVLSATGASLALGFYNPRTDIVFRRLTGHTGETIDRSFWERRIRSALALRGRILSADTTACRLMNAEGDAMPGLVVDRYGEFLVMTVATAGFERIKTEIAEILDGELKPRGIYERSGGRARRREGLKDHAGILSGERAPTPVEIRESGLVFDVDIAGGQKTGFFLDQRENRRLLSTLCRDARVLNCFAYTGAFSVYAASGGAARVVSVEVSEAANNRLARVNLSKNGRDVGTHPVITADVFDFLRETNDVFDTVILDPPAFAKEKKDLATAARGYREINLQAARHLVDGGLLATFSCSHHIGEDLFAGMVLRAVRDAGKRARVLRRMGAGPDHPVDLGHPEGGYLKGLLLSVDS